MYLELIMFIYHKYMYTMPIISHLDSLQHTSAAYGLYPIATLLATAWNDTMATAGNDHGKLQLSLTALNDPIYHWIVFGNQQRLPADDIYHWIGSLPAFNDHCNCQQVIFVDPIKWSVVEDPSNDPWLSSTQPCSKLCRVKDALFGWLKTRLIMRHRVICTRILLVILPLTLNTISFLKAITHILKARHLPFWGPLGANGGYDPRSLGDLAGLELFTVGSLNHSPPILGISWLCLPWFRYV